MNINQAIELLRSDGLFAEAGEGEANTTRIIGAKEVFEPDREAGYSHRSYIDPFGIYYIEQHWIARVSGIGLYHIEIPAPSLEEATGIVRNFYEPTLPFDQDGSITLEDAGNKLQEVGLVVDETVPTIYGGIGVAAHKSFRFVENFVITRKGTLYVAIMGRNIIDKRMPSFKVCKTLVEAVDAVCAFYKQRSL
jgi:hypothetical protein